MSCPRCSCPDCRAISATGADVIERKVADLRQSCRESGITVTPDGYVNEDGAAALLGLAKKTLANWRSMNAPLPFRRVHGRVWYPLTAIAAELVRGARG